MRTLIFLSLILIFGCTKSDNNGKLITHNEIKFDSIATNISFNHSTTPLTNIEKFLIENIAQFKPDKSIPFREIQKLTANPFTDNCAMIVREIVTLNSTDTIVHLIDKCKKNVLGILAAKYEYPDGVSTIESYILNDTITTIHIDGFLGSYYNDYYETVQDSLTVKSVYHKQKLVYFFKDSIRSINKVVLNK